MLEREELLNFEQSLLNLAKENALYTSDSPFISILDQSLQTKKYREDLEDLLGSTITESTKEKSIFDEDIEEVGELESLLPDLASDMPEGDDQIPLETESDEQEESDIPPEKEASTEASAAPPEPTEPTEPAEPTEPSLAPPVSSAPSRQEPEPGAGKPTAEDAAPPTEIPPAEVEATSQEAQEAQEEGVESAVAEDAEQEDAEQVDALYSEVEGEDEEKEDYEEFTGFFLPETYRTLQQPLDAPDAKRLGLDQQAFGPSAAVEQEMELQRGFGEISDFDLEEYERSIEAEGSEFDESLFDKLIAEQAEEARREEGPGRVSESYFNEEDELLFFENLKTYNIFIQRAVIEIINSENADAAMLVLDAVLNKMAPNMLRKNCEKLLDEDLPEFRHANVYTPTELEQELRTLKDNLLKVSRHVFIDILPKVGIALFLLLTGYVWVLQPLRAWRHYEKGYEHLVQGEYRQSEESFKTAGAIRYMQTYYFRYADEYLRQNSYTEAEKKYTQLLFGLNDDLRKYLVRQVRAKDYFFSASIAEKQRFLFDIVNFRREGFLRLIAFEKEQKGDLQFALALYDLWLYHNAGDIDFRLGMADTYIEMYDKTRVPQYLALAREKYDREAKNSEYDARVLLARIRWAVRVETEEAETYIREVVLRNRLPLFVPYKPEFYATYTELVAQRLRKGDTTTANEILDILRAEHADDALLSFLQAKSYFASQYYEEAMQEFTVSFQQYAQKERLKAKDFLHSTDIKIHQAEIVLAQEDNMVWAEDLLYDAQQLYEQKLTHVRQEDKRELARLYYLQSKIQLERREIETALLYAQRAEQEDYNPLSLQYHYGLLQYLREDWNEAGKVFLTLLPQFPEKTKNRKELLFSAANTQYMRENYMGAAAYYQEALREQGRYFQGGDLSLLDNSELDSSVAQEVDRLAYIRNNLGVTYYALYRQQPYRDDYLSMAMRELREANTILENRNRSGSIRKLYQELPALNLALLLGTTEGYSPQIFDVIARELPESPDPYILNTMLAQR